MYVRVDVEETKEEIEGYSYVNSRGKDESVTMASTLVVIEDSGSGTSSIYYEDIPNLIKALKAAYKYKTGNTL